MPQVSGLMLTLLQNRALILGLIFMAVLVTAFGVSWLIRPRSAVERRLAAVNVSAVADRPYEVVLPSRETGGFLRLLDRPERPTKAAAKRDPLRERLARAGYNGPGAIVYWHLARILTAFVLPAIVVGGFVAFAGSHDLVTTLLIVIASCGLGFVLPGMWLDRRVSARTQAIRVGFPDMLDMILVCVEAGLGIDAAIHRTATEIGRAHRVIGHEMDCMTAELRAGKPRSTVLKEFAIRLDVEEVRSFVTVLSHAEQFGTSIGDALRVYAGEMRNRRMLRAEEEANKLPVKLSFVVAGCTFPALLMLVLTPMLITVMRAFAPVH